MGLGESQWRKPQPASEHVPIIWMHAVSVGEVNLLESIIDALPANFSFAISTTTETGYDLAIQKYGKHQVFFCPFDFSWAVRRTIETVQPSAIVLAELEIWPNLISIADELGIPVIVANGRLSDKSLRGYRRFAWITRRCFERLSFVGAQSETYANRFIQLGCPEGRVSVTGSVKFDGAKTDRNNAITQQLVAAAGFRDQDVVFVAGSTQLEEDRMVADVYLKLKPNFPELRVVLVPRHPERCGQLASELAELGIEFSMRSQQIAVDTGDAAVAAPIDFLLVDVIGELGAWWGRADVGYVGGSMGSREGQNMIEPAAFGVPVSFGPRTRNFREVVEQLLAAEAAVVVHCPSDLSRFVREAFENRSAMEAMGGRAREIVIANRGASKRTAEIIERMTSERGTRSSFAPPK